ncbi:hypothetical protein F5141DRAFT_1204130 [Pisolithus sp. B1]|nr:hypothetical protein F5141DRAFT_1204130 [Pisolithus sp. B1]
MTNGQVLAGSSTLKYLKRAISSLVQCLLSHQWSWKRASRHSRAHTLSCTSSLMMVVTQYFSPTSAGFASGSHSRQN